jgi:hypothetical protein
MGKGQAAVEYITTYGWALLALLIVIVALFESGFLTPNYLVSEECSFGTNFQCGMAMFNEGGATKVSMAVFNGYPYKINITGIDIRTQDGSQSVTGLISPGLVNSGARATVLGTLGGAALPDGSVKRFYGNITFTQCAPELSEPGKECSSIENTVAGRIVAKVIKQ